METIDMTPTWAELMPILVEVAANGATVEGRKQAMTELKRLASIADTQYAHRRAWETLTPTGRHATTRNMERHGGGFVAALGEAWSRADLTNSVRLAVAFPELVQSYKTTKVPA